MTFLRVVFIETFHIYIYLNSTSTNNRYNKMEEYRRKYLSPSYRNSAVLEVLSHDKSVSELRQELHECR